VGKGVFWTEYVKLHNDFWA